MNLIHALTLALVAAAQPPKISLYEFLRDIDPPRTGQHLEIKLKNKDESINGVLKKRTDSCYTLKTDENRARIIHILTIETLRETE